ncbi:hypothetical protein AXK56_11670 [Tsukamurella pulmonis]|uniref:Uncharacterized protein n=1 Tax=Tsukamurella pulmonis TaxID=47312 RepID=A0A1H1H534_9ACTN|nr:hypothetical protein [Tsukamurella pulmonis]KXO88038.1 hypothetical protein AXK56_11670 [Tsukamurella pulmonis]SDR20560.1 hypothetical protein SAMN04489765_3824 [Tsukamurella pulmonis]SUP15926.1 Uncharacterised protein [Tsukamurella pulmonis]
MPRKDPHANRAARDFMQHLVPAYTEELTSAVKPLIELAKKCRADDHKPTINEVHQVLHELHLALKASEEMKWELLAATRPAGSSVEYIARASHTAYSKTKARLSMHPISRAKGVNFVRVDTHMRGTGGADSDFSDFRFVVQKISPQVVGWELWFPDSVDPDGEVST